MYIVPIFIPSTITVFFSLGIPISFHILCFILDKIVHTSNNLHVCCQCQLSCKFIFPLQVIYFTSLFPYAILLVLLIYGLTLEGASNGLKYYLYPNPALLLNGGVWKDALVQIFFSLGVGWGCLITLASYNE